MSVDPDCQPEIVAMIGASIAISISDVPWNGPISGCSVGMIDGEYIINPDRGAEKDFSDGNNSCLNKHKNCYDRGRCKLRI